MTQEEFFTDLLKEVSVKTLLQEAERDLAMILDEKHILDTLALTIGCYLGNRQGIDIYDLACQVLSAETA